MGKWTPVPVAGGCYSDDCKPFSVQDTVNRIPVMAEREGTRSPAMLRDLPGCAVFSILDSGAPVRGSTDVEGLLLVVSGTTLYSLAPDGMSTSLGTIPGVGRVTFAHNQITGGSQVAIATGDAGYVYNTVTGVLAQITDAGFPGAKVFDFCDGYILFVEPLGRYWGHSNLADATDYNTLDRSEAEAQPDKIMTLIVSHREAIVLGQKTTEFFRNEGGATGTFQRINGTEAEVGAAGTHAVAKLDNTVFVVGHDGIGYRLNGYQFQRITTHPIEQAWSRCDLSQAYCYTFEDQGHKVWYVTMTDGQTWGYDVASGEWHRRKSYGLDFWRMSTLTRWNGRWIGGDYSNGTLYQLDWRLNSDAGEPKERMRTFSVSHDHQNRFTVNAVELVYATGITDASFPQPVASDYVLTITGDMGDGYSGESEVGNYTVAGSALGPDPLIEVIDGAIPAGLSINDDGEWSGIRTTVGVYNWTMQVTDSVGRTATLDDTSETLDTDFWMAELGHVGATDYVYKVDAGTGALTGPILIQDVPGDQMAMTQDFAHLLMPNNNSSSLSKIAVADSSVTNIAVSASPSGIACNETHYYLTHNSGSKNIVKRLLSDNTVVLTSAAMTFAPRECQLTPDGARLLVTTQNNELYVLDTSNLSLLHTITLGVGQSAACLRVHPDGTKAYFVETLAEKVDMIDLSSYAVTQWAGISNVIPYGVLPSPDGQYVYVLKAAQIYRCNPSTGTPALWVSSMGGANYAGAINAAGTRIYVSCTRATGVIDTVDLASQSVIATVTVGTYGKAITAGPLP